MSSCKSRRASGALMTARVSVLTLALAALAGGCATNSGPSKVAGPVARYPGDPAPRTAVARSTPVELEADGYPVQLAPRNRRPMRDDPSEPWSPNYGTVRSSEAEPEPARGPVATAAVVSTHSARPSLDPDDIIRVAIAEHEMRQR